MARGHHKQMIDKWILVLTDTRSQNPFSNTLLESIMLISTAERESTTLPELLMSIAAEGESAATEAQKSIKRWGTGLLGAGQLAPMQQQQQGGFPASKRTKHGKGGKGSNYPAGITNYPGNANYPAGNSNYPGGKSNYPAGNANYPGPNIYPGGIFTPEIKIYPRHPKILKLGAAKEISGSPRPARRAVCVARRAMHRPTACTRSINTRTSTHRTHSRAHGLTRRVSRNQSSA